MSQYGESIAFILYLNHSTSNDLDDRVRVRLLGREPVVRDEVAHRQPVLIVVVANDELAVCVGEIFRPCRAIIAAAVPLLGGTQGALARQERPIPEPPFPWLRGEPGAAELPVVILRTGGGVMRIHPKRTVRTVSRACHACHSHNNSETQRRRRRITKQRANAPLCPTWRLSSAIRPRIFRHGT